MVTPRYSLIEKAILKTLIYGDIFDYPLTDSEVYTYLICSVPLSKQKIRGALRSLNTKKIIGNKQSFYFLKGRELLVVIREKREKSSKEKLKIVHSLTAHFYKIPTVKFIGITGGLAMMNAEDDDDIDLLVIAEKKRMWTTRLAITLMLQSLGMRRKRGEKRAKNKICINMFMDERFLGLPSEDRDLYKAHEIVQTVPLLDKDNTYQRFIYANKWAGEFLPNSLNSKCHPESTLGVMKDLDSSPAKRDQNDKVNILESFAKNLQLWYMKNHATRETITDSLLAFHPIDYRTKILSEYQKRLEKYKIE